MYKRHQSTSVAVTLEIAKDMVQYDKYAKLVLSNKQILARVFEEVVWEVKGNSIDEIAKMIGADSLGFLPVECLGELTGCQSCCSACFDGEYPTDIPADTRKNRFEQRLSERTK